MAVIETERLRLRAVEERDAPAIVAALNDWSVSQWLVRPPYPYAESDAHDFIRWTREAAAEGFSAKFAIADRMTDECLGVVTIDPAGDRAELGYWLAASAAGRGYMTEAVAAVLADARPRLPGVVLFATIDPENGRSERVLTKSGFRLVGRKWLTSRRKRGSIESMLFELPA